MYRTCLFCNGDLGSNDAVEQFPVGRRLAFDAARGRLWVVCTRCLRWNLTPLEERWESIETCERLYRGTTRRVSTENIGLARLPSGLELVRIGEPQRPEFAAWRYGAVLRSRRRRMWIIGGVTTATALGVAYLGAAAVAAAGAGGVFLYADVPSWMVALRRRYATVTRVPASSGETGIVRGLHVKSTIVMPGAAPGSVAIQVAHSAGTSQLSGDAATRVLGRLLAAANRNGAGEHEVHNAAREIEKQGSAERFIAQTSRRYADQRDGPPIQTVTGAAVSPAALAAWGLEDRLALEMALHESTERAAMEGELATLEAAWREAEEVAAISDDLFIPASVRSALRRMRGESTRGEDGSADG
ncbi:MAG: hypothetical protein ACT4P7_20450 [Gemmatimonadaceae bacterium]